MFAQVEIWVYGHLESQRRMQEGVSGDSKTESKQILKRKERDRERESASKEERLI